MSSLVYDAVVGFATCPLLSLRQERRIIFMLFALSETETKRKERSTLNLIGKSRSQ